jgi:hypothetical protein
LAGFRKPGEWSTDGLSVERCANAAVDWIRLAQVKGRDGGISKGYHLLRGYWYPSYPETTGYTIPTLLNASAILHRPELRALSLELGDYLLEKAMPQGGVKHWGKSSSEAIAFDTGQVIFGWMAVFESSGEERYLRAAAAAGDWLVSAQDRSGSWRAHQYLGVEKVIDTRVAWALLELYDRVPEESYRNAAVRNLEWAVRHQQTNGWFDRCVFVEGEDPITHTLAYTAEGFLECGCWLDEPSYIDTAQRTADALLTRQRVDGSLASAFGPAWQESRRSSCLTGNCQVSHLWLRLYERTGDQAYYVAAKKGIEFVAHTQHLDGSIPNIRGAVAGSWPLYGRYERFKYPNWAAKFFIDALFLLHAVENRDHRPYYVG